MKNTTLCYITRGNEVLMLHRVKKENDLNKDKWIGIGGKFEGDETPDECLLREAKEETGLTLTNWRCRGVSPSSPPANGRENICICSPLMGLKAR